MDGRRLFASIIGGFITLSIFLGVLIYSIILIRWVFKGNIYYMQQNSEEATESGIFNVTVAEYID